MNRTNIPTYPHDGEGQPVGISSSTDIHRSSCSSFSTTSPWSRWILSRNSENNRHSSIEDAVNNETVYTVLSNCSSPTSSTGLATAEALTDSPVSVFPFMSSSIYENIPPSITPAPAVPDILEASLGYTKIPKSASGGQLLTNPSGQQGCLPHCACRTMTTTASTSASGGSRSPLDVDSKFGFVDRARMVSFKRKKVTPASGASSESADAAGCSQCTCFLDPVNLSQNLSAVPTGSISVSSSGSADRHDYENAENVVNTVIMHSGFSLPHSGPDLMLAMDSPVLDKSRQDSTDTYSNPKVHLATGAVDNRRNKLNLTIDTGANERRNECFYDPIYEFLMSSPVLRKLKELGFQYPTFPTDGCNKDNKRLRLLYIIIVFLLLVVVALIILNVLAPKIFEHSPPGNSFPYIIDNASSNSPVISTTSAVSNNMSPKEIDFSDASPSADIVRGDHTGSPETEDVNTENMTDRATGDGVASVQFLENTTTVQNQETVFPLPGAVDFSNGNNAGNASTQDIRQPMISSSATVQLTGSEGWTRSVSSRQELITSLSSVGGSVISVPSSQMSTASVTSLIPVSYPPDFKCPLDQFKCRAGVSRMPCLYQWERCDGIADCSDGSDEEFCDTIKCFGNFQCADKTCVALAKVCNGIFDCPDGSDEQQCDKFKCQSYEYRCPSGYCIPKEWVCDGEADCPGHYDEYNCSSTCSSGQFRCPEGWCIPSTWRCNGARDCAGGQDEENCSCPKEGQLKCVSGGDLCIDKEKLCDGKPDCADSSDEWNCVIVQNDALMMKEQGEEQLIPVCSQEWSKQDADLACRQLAYEKSDAFWEIPLNDTHGHVFVKSAQSFPFTVTDRVQFLVKKKPVSECSTGKAVGISCQKYECGHWSGDDNELKENRIRRMVGGRISDEHEWPSVAVLYHPQKKWACTASVIAPYWLLTSALCVRRTDASPIDWKVIAGNADPSETDPNRQIARSVVRFVQHPSYKLFLSLLADYDVMLVQLSDSLPLATSSSSIAVNTPYVSAICMPERPTSPPDRCVTAGWGYTAPGGYFINKRLKHLPVGIWPREVCNSTAHYPGLLSERSICASNDKDDWGPCFNDEGSPLMCYSETHHHWYLAGVLTSQSCGSAVKHPAVYADVYSMRNWINGVIGRPIAT